MSEGPLSKVLQVISTAEIKLKIVQMLGTSVRAVRHLAPQTTPSSAPPRLSVTISLLTFLGERD